MSPFAGYKDFATCILRNKDKKSPEAYCAAIHYRATGKWPAQKNVLPGMLTCPVCSNPVRVSRENIRLRCPLCRTNLISVKISKVKRK